MIEGEILEQPLAETAVSPRATAFPPPAAADWVLDHHDGLLAFCLFLARDAQAAEDLAQETFLVALRKRSQERVGIRDVPRWLRGIARVLLANRRRHDARYDEILRERLAALTDDRWEELDPTESRQAALEACLQDLGETHRRIVEDFYSGGVGLDIQARRLGIGHGALRTRLHRLRRLLKRCLEKKLIRS
jgi:RNA polymerase sigma factor (sigma-70 family)